MARVVSSKETVQVEVSTAELRTLLIQPAKDQGFIDFDPTRVAIEEDQAAPGNHIITFERIAT